MSLKVQNFDFSLTSQGELVEIAWKIFMGRTSIEILEYIKEMLAQEVVQPSQLQRRILSCPCATTSIGGRTGTTAYAVNAMRVAAFAETSNQDDGYPSDLKVKNMVRKHDGKTSGEMALNGGDDDARIRWKRAPCVQVLICVMKRRAQTQGRWTKFDPWQFGTKLRGNVDETSCIVQSQACYQQSSPALEHRRGSPERLANGGVQTHEEAQVFVHDLNLFVTVQLLDETAAVLSLGKLCEDHGYCYGWVSGQKPRLTKDGKTIICKTDNFVPLVVPGLSSNPESSSSSASLSQDSLRKEAERATRHLVPSASSWSSSSVSKRSDELATRTLVPFPEIQNQK